MSGRANKVVFLGSVNVGKSCLIGRLVHNRYNPFTTPTTGGSFGVVRRTKYNTEVRLNLWDTAGQERFDSIIPIFIRGATIVCICFDTMSVDAFNSIQKNINLATLHASNAAIVLVKTKSDLTDFSKGSENDIERRAFEEGYSLISVSGKTGEGVDDLIDHLVSVGVMNNFPDPDVIKFEDVYTSSEVGKSVIGRFKSRFCGT